MQKNEKYTKGSKEMYKTKTQEKKKEENNQMVFQRYLKTAKF